MATPSGSMLTKLSDTGQMVEDRSDDLRGRTVKDKDGHGVGKVSDMLIDDQTQKARFLLVQHGGFLGLGEKESFMPVEAIAKITNDAVYVDRSHDHIAGAPQYDPALVDARPYYDSAYNYYGYPPRRLMGW